MFPQSWPHTPASARSLLYSLRAVSWLKRRRKAPILKRYTKTPTSPCCDTPARESPIHTKLRTWPKDAFLKLSSIDLSKIEVPRAYLTRMVSHAIVTRFRRKAARERLLARYSTLNSDSRESDPAAGIEAEEVRGVLRDSIANLPPHYQSVLALVEEGLKPKQIAAVLASRRGRPVTPNQVSALLMRIKDALAVELRRRGFVHTIFPWLGLRRKISRWANWFRSLGTEVPLLAQQVSIAALTSVVGAASPVGNVSMEPWLEVTDSHETSASSWSVVTHETPARPGGPAGTSGDSEPTVAEIARVDLPGDQGTLRGEERRGEPAPPPEEQLLEIVRDPSRVPIPECGGIPLPVCEQ